MKNNGMELLAPAGSMEALKAAAVHGADAIYAGGAKFGARAYADNFDTEQLKEALDFLHLREKKLYLTVNTLLKQHELYEELYEQMLPLYEHGLDGVIVQDLGVLSFLKEAFPNLLLHASTQMTVTSASSALWLKQQGVARVVPARELSLTELAMIKEESEMELEVFVHGALCYCYSGQCLYSSMLGGRSGNRGRCAQPCRLNYRIDGLDAYYMSLKDLNGLQALPALWEAGVDSLKIEGRMKSPEYTAATVSVYRKYLDRLYQYGTEGYRVEQNDLGMLEELFNRGGFTSGYYKQHNGSNMMSPYRPNHYGHKIGQARFGRNGYELNLREDAAAKDVIEVRGPREEVLDRLTLKSDLAAGTSQMMTGNKKRFPNASYQLNQVAPVYRVHHEALLNYWKKEHLSEGFKRPINGFASFFAGQPMVLTVIDEKTGKSAVAEGAVLEPARSAQATEDQLRHGLEKTGDTPFVFAALEVMVGDAVFVPKQQLNSLRRTALAQLEAELLKDHHANHAEALPKPLSVAKEQTAERELHVQVTTLEQLEAVVINDQVSRIYVEDGLWINKRQQVSELLAAVDVAKRYLAMTPVFRLQAASFYELQMKDIQTQFAGVLVRTLDSFGFMKAHGYTGRIVCDHSLYAWNDRAAEMLRKEVPERTAWELTAPQELNGAELSKNQVAYDEIVVYGRTTLMVTANCIRKTRVTVAADQKKAVGSNISCCDGKQELLYLKDRYNKEFPVWNQCGFCYNVIWNGTPLHLLDQLGQIEKLHIPGIRLSFTTESAMECELRIQEFSKGWLENRPIPGTRQEGMFTRGHFKRGVE